MQVLIGGILLIILLVLLVAFWRVALGFIVVAAVVFGAGVAFMIHRDDIRRTTPQPAYCSDMGDAVYTVARKQGQDVAHAEAAMYEGKEWTVIHSENVLISTPETDPAGSRLPGLRYFSSSSLARLRPADAAFVRHCFGVVVADIREVENLLAVFVFPRSALDLDPRVSMLTGRRSSVPGSTHVRFAAHSGRRGPECHH
ncbi:MULTISPECIES: hypothetical protein [Caballeronia]|uniref:hypothetical protein n=1 Tax=Caballeronia TaxID=1827195 RepID=UPI001FD4BAA6|nr:MULTISPECIES: hypothetical protein [Caballeronia]MDR5799171.1 hypothetical protein [Caballeronia sp. LZ001]